MDTAAKIEKVKQRITGEQRVGPERIGAAQTIAGSSGGGVRTAYCKTDTGTGNTWPCYLDTDETGTEITVYFDIHNPATPGSSENFNSVLDIVLFTGRAIPVIKRNDGEWWYLNPVEVMRSKNCDA